MKERELRDLIAEVKTGQLSRRAFVQRMIAVGLTAPMAGMMLAQSGVPMQAAEIPYKPTKAGGGGLLKILYWQAVTLLNPHFAVGTKDQDGSRIFYEPLAGWDSEGNLVPILAAEIPSKENNGLAEDGLSVLSVPGSVEVSASVVVSNNSGRRASKRSSRAALRDVRPV